MEISPAAPRTPEQNKAAALERCGEVLGITAESLDSKKVVVLGSAGGEAWLGRAVAERAADSFTVDYRDGPKTDGPVFSGDAAAELGERAVEQDFVIADEGLSVLAPGFEPDLVISADTVFGILSSAPNEWLPEVVNGIGAWAWSLARGGEFRFGPIPEELSAEDRRRLDLLFENFGAGGCGAEIAETAAGARYVAARRNG